MCNAPDRDAGRVGRIGLMGRMGPLGADTKVYVRAAYEGCAGMTVVVARARSRRGDGGNEGRRGDGCENDSGGTRFVASDGSVLRGGKGTTERA
ncbi:MAG TPA: hypothetical protein P5179_06845, partial [Candidatus Latescibacteria bacterium]|nr:hypothetical protein [Candidatus Latescibacterota bacterium]